MTTTSSTVPTYSVATAAPTYTAITYCSPTANPMKPLNRSQHYRDNDIPINITFSADDPNISINGTVLTLLIKDDTTGIPLTVVTKTMTMVVNSDQTITGRTKLAVADLSTLAVGSAVELEYRVKAAIPDPLVGTINLLVDKGIFISNPALP